MPYNSKAAKDESFFQQKDDVSGNVKPSTPLLTEEQIVRMFSDFGLCEENEREKYRSLESLSSSPSPFVNFIDLSDSTKPDHKEVKDAELAPTP